ncbi:MAG: hypothetical protein ACFFFB_17430 [Candidatus Heimdallarchaeota archaeon]
MVIIIERVIQRIANGKWEELEKLDKQFNELEAHFGFPKKKRFRYMSGAYDTQTLVIERQWQSMALIEKAYVKAFLDSDYQKLSEKIEPIVEWEKIELLIPHPPVPE